MCVCFLYLKLKYCHFTVPLQPRNLQARAISPNEIEITWDAPEDIDKIISYTLYYNDSEKHQNGQIEIRPPTVQYVLTELVPDTTYHIQLSARSVRGEGARTPLIQERTPEFSKKSCFIVCLRVWSVLKHSLSSSSFSSKMSHDVWQYTR